MENFHKNLHLVWDVSKFRLQINDVDVAIAPAQLPPYKCDAIVEEQDSDLILDDTQEIRDPGDKPVWYLANKLESATRLSPGQVIVRDTVPLRLQAVIHDLETEPSCNELWIFQAIQQIFEIAESRGIRALQMPLLGTRFSQIQSGQFIDILLEIITRQRPAPIHRLWLMTSEQNCEPLFNDLSRLLRD